MLDDIRYGFRFFRVALTLARYGALFPLDEFDLPRPVMALARMMGGGRRDLGARPGERLSQALQVLGPSFIKLGQALATRPDVIGEDVARDLAALQDRLPPFDSKAAVATLEDEFGRPLSALFSAFAPDPVAAASIAQVHFATTIEGREVAVKILRPGIEARFEEDFRGFLWLARKMERRLPQSRRLRPVEVVRLMAETVRGEMDLRLEAAAASELAEVMADYEGYVLPKPDWERTSRRVLTMERVDGIPLTQRQAVIDAGHDAKRLARIVVQSFLWQSMRRGVFHADMHPGNLFVDRQGRIVAIDFGIMGRLDKETRRYLALILLGISNRDYLGVARLHFEAGYVPRGRSVEAFAQALRSVAEPIVGRPVQDISFGRMLGQLFAITRAFDMETQPQLLLLQKTMVMVEGVAQNLDPSINMWETARPVLEGWAQKQAGPEARIVEAGEILRAVLHNLPKALERLAQEPMAPVEPDLSSIAREVKRLRWTVLLLCGIVASALLAAFL
jgi:ubiquinone biosynthesis protein